MTPKQKLKFKGINQEELCVLVPEITHN